MAAGRDARPPPGPATDRGGDGTGGECAGVSFLKNDSKHELALRSGEGRLPERRARSAGCVFGEKSSRSLLFTFRKNQFPMDDRSKCDNENAFGRERESSSCGPSGGRPLRRGAAGTRGDPGWAAVEGLRVSGGSIEDDDTTSPGCGGRPRRRKKRRRDGKCGSEFAGREPRPAPSLPGGRAGDAPHQKTDGLKKKKSIKNVEKALTIDPWMKFIFREAEAGVPQTY